MLFLVLRFPFRFDTNDRARVLFWLLTSFCEQHRPGWISTLDRQRVLEPSGEAAVLAEFDRLSHTELAVCYEGMRLLGEDGVVKLKEEIEKRHGFRF